MSILAEIQAAVPDATNEELANWHDQAVQCGQPLTVEEFIDWRKYDDKGLLKQAKKAEIFGAVIIKSHSNISSNPSKPKFVPMVVCYDDEQIGFLIGTKPGPYGRRWTYGGTQGFDESNILVVIKEPNKDDVHVTFVGRTGLNEALDFLVEQGIPQTQYIAPNK